MRFLFLVLVCLVPVAYAATPFAPLPTATGAVDVFCPPQPGAAYTSCWAWTYQADEPGEPWRGAGTCLYRNSDKLPTIPQTYEGEYWFPCPQYCRAPQMAHCQANATPTTGYRGSCHVSCSPP